jgi:hypothetical protein
MPGTPWQPLPQLLRFFGVVEDQKPPVPMPQFSKHRPLRDGGIGAGIGAV